MPLSNLEDAQHRSQFLDQVIEALPDALVLTDEQGQILSCNRAIFSIFGLTPEEATQKSMGDLIRAEHWAVIKGLLAASRETDSTDELRVARRITGVSKAGGHFPISLNIAACSLGGRRQFAFVIRDIASILNTEKELERSNEELQHFAAAASHDLQAPLRTISSFTSSVLGESSGLSAEARGKLERVVSACGRMRSLTESLLELARISRKAPTFEPVNTNRIFDELVKDLGAVISEAGATVTRGDLPPVLGDEAQLRQVFQNLIANGIKFRRKDVPPSVMVTAGPARPGYRQIRVSDNGIGIDPAHHSKIFEIFQRLHGRSQFNGSGIGLAMAKKIVERFGGEIGVESRVGEGSCFFFTLKEADKAA